MAIYNQDGSVYNPTGCLNFFDPNSPEQDLFNVWDSEILNIVGTPIFYYEVFIQSQTVDPLYWEDRGKIWSTIPIELKGYYDPIPSQNLMNMFGIDAPDEIMMEFNYRDVLNRIGHPPKIGSRLYTPHKRENWVIVQRNVDQFKLWGEIRLKLMCQRFQQSATDASVHMTNADTGFKIN